MNAIAGFRVLTGLLLSAALLMHCTDSASDDPLQPCVPDCAGRQCGDDRCGGSCGSCDESEICDESDQCVCAPVCQGKQCGDDQCGGSCGTCEGSELCNASFQCEATSTSPAFEEYAISLMGPVTFEDEELGDFTLQEHRDLFNQGEPFYKEASVAAFNLPGELKPQIVEYTYECNGETRTSRGVQYTQEAGTYWDQIPVQLNLRLPYDARAYDFYLSYNITMPASGWANVEAGREWKNPGWIAGYGYEPDYPNGRTPDMLENEQYGSFSYNQARDKTMGHGTAVPNVHKHVQYPKGGFLQEPNPYIVNPLRDPANPTDPAPHLWDNDGRTYNITVRGYLGDIGQANAFAEYFIDGEYSYRWDEYQGAPIKWRDIPITVDVFEIKYHWGGNAQDIPVVDAPIIYDDFVLFFYEPDYERGLYGGIKSEDHRILDLPVWDAALGCKLEYDG